MSTYKNGYIPRSMLVLIASGTNQHGYWEHLLSPATKARHDALVARAKARTGRTLAMGAGWSAYRPYAEQVKARQIYGNGAAVPGTSSHGGFWEGKQTLAMDFSNWSTVYGGDRAAFFADCRAAGLEPDLISPRRGYPDEPWHVVCSNPWSAVPAGGGATPFPSQEDDMTPDQAKQLDFIYKALAGPNNGTTATTKPLGWQNIGGDAQTSNYGILPIVIHNQTLIGKQAAELAAVRSVVEQLAKATGVTVDMKQVQAAAQAGAQAAVQAATASIAKAVNDEAAKRLSS